MKIVSSKSLGFQRVYSPEMKSDYHNYMTDSTDVVHANSHAVAYAAVIAYRCAWFKAHFFPEWIASVLTRCDVKKIPRYISMARTEGWKPTHITNIGREPADRYKKFDIIAFDVNKLTSNFSVIGNVLTVGLLSVKGIGESDRPICDVSGPFESIDDFIEKTGAGKSVIERLIKLRAFQSLNNHHNANALLQYYYYKYKKYDSKTRIGITNALMEQQGWNEGSIHLERAKLKQDYLEMYPKRKKIPPKFDNWMPDVVVTIEEFLKLYPNDFKMTEILEFEKEYLGYNLSNPLSIYVTRPDRTIFAAIEAYENNIEQFIEVIILEKHIGSTKNGTSYCRLEVTDGLATTSVFIWEDNLGRINPDLLNKEKAVMIPVKYQPKRKSFSICKDSILVPLQRKDHE